MSRQGLPELFARAVDLDAEGRQAFLAALRAAEPALAAELETLLAASAVDDWEVDRSPWHGLAAAAPQHPERIGPFRLCRELGRGGMGRVYLAEEETPDYRRTVALKVIDRPGPDAEAVRRFRDEVRILASLDHPGIARFLAGGQSPEGTWYLALEHVEGEDLVGYAARHELPVRARVELMAVVADCVHYAHERGVVHRDLKPGHLLVGADGRPRLLDFGISKLLAPEDGAADAVTRTELRAFTPLYASPEQFRGEPATAASDVYSLGVILYQLLAGRRPFEREDGAPGDLERAVLERDPEPPSTAARRLATTRPPAATTERAETTRRGGLDRDLDAICLKALRKQPTDRNASARELADDLRRFLDGRPVAARSGGLRYRAARLLRRQRGRLATAAALLLALVGLALAVRSSREVARLRPPPPPDPRPFPFTDVTTKPVEHWEKAFAAAPDSVEAGAALALALVYADRVEEAALVLARLRQVPAREKDPLNDYVDGVIAHHSDQPQRALVLYTRARDGALAAGRGELVGRARASRGRMLAVLGQHEEGEREMKLAFADYERAGDTIPAAQVLNNLAIEALQRGDYVRGEKRLEGALARFRAGGSTGSVVLRNLAEVASRRGQPDRAEQWARASLELEKSGGREHQGRRLWVLGEALAEQGRATEAIAVLDEAIGYLRASDDRPDLASALLVRGRIEIAAARFAGVGAMVREIEDGARASGDRSILIAALLLRGTAAAARGDVAGARRDLADARRAQVEQNEPVLAALTDVERATVELDGGDRARALAILDDPSTQAGNGSSAGVLAEMLRARIDAEAGRLDAARQRLAARGEAEATAPSLFRRLVFLRARAALARGGGRLSDARRDLAAAAAAARGGGRVADDLACRLAAAELDGDRGRAERRRLAGEARGLGLLGLARRGESDGGGR